MKTSFGPRYLHENPGRRQVSTCWAVKKLRFGYLVFEVVTGRQLEVFSSRTAAQYAASRMNGMEDVANSLVGDVL